MGQHTWGQSRMLYIFSYVLPYILLSIFCMMLPGCGSTQQRDQPTWEEHSHLLLRACWVDHQQMMTLFSPFGGRPPTTGQQFNQMEMAMRRMGYSLEGIMPSLASQLYRPTLQPCLTQQGMQPSASLYDQHGSQDLWTSQASSSSWAQPLPLN